MVEILVECMVKYFLGIVRYFTGVLYFLGVLYESSISCIFMLFQ